MSISGGELGFDEGGVLNAIMSRPVYRKETEEWKYNKKGLPLKHWTTNWDVALGDILIPLVLGGLITLSPLFLSRLTMPSLPNIPSLPSLPSLPPIPGLPKPPSTLSYGDYLNIYGPILGPILWAARQL